MQAIGGGEDSVVSTCQSISAVSKTEDMAAVREQESSGTSEASSCSTTAAEYGAGGGEDGELELGLGLALGPSTKPKVSTRSDCCKILTARDFPSMAATKRPAISGMKRAAGSVPHEAESTSPNCELVGWPPVQLYRKNSFVNHSQPSAENAIDVDKNGLPKMEGSNSNIDTAKNNREKVQRRTFHFVKVSMDGVAIGRKLDLNAHSSYQTLALALEDMFHRPVASRSSGHLEDGMVIDARKLSKLFDKSSEYVLTYEDREGDWMLVGDVPWRMFLGTAKRLRIIRTSEAARLGK